MPVVSLLVTSLRSGDTEAVEGDFSSVTLKQGMWRCYQPIFVQQMFCYKEDPTGDRTSLARDNILMLTSNLEVGSEDMQFAQTIVSATTSQWHPSIVYVVANSPLVISGSPILARTGRWVDGGGLFKWTDFIWSFVRNEGWVDGVWKILTLLGF